MVDRQILIEKISAIEGLSNDEKSSLLQLLRATPKYGLVWEDKSEEAEQRMQKDLPVLTEVKERAIISESPDAPNHILIEGDNLHALTTLTYTHEGKIDVIYIDPPYNTGNKDFVYNDSYVDREDGYRHSKWLSFMSKRLRIAKRLLSDRGVIFISIDDNEQAQLKLLCDEIFGEDNFIANIIWQSTPGSNTGEDLKTVTEYVLVYSIKRYAQRFYTQKVHDEEKYKNFDAYSEYRGGYIPNKLDRRMTGSHYSDSLNYPITCPDGTILYPGGEKFKQQHWNWRWSSSKLKWGIDKDFIIFTQRNGKWSVYFKQYLKVDNNDQPIIRSVSYQNLLLKDGLNAARGTREVIEIFGQKGFDYPKPLALLDSILNMSTRGHSIILDFFAGSGTTLHATMKLNAEDGGKRQCILVTNNENGICENVTYERNRRVIQGYTNSKGEEVAGLKENNLRYFRTELGVPREATTTSMRQLMSASTDMLRIKNSIYTEHDHFCGKKLRKAYARYFEDETNGKMLVVYREEMIEHLVPLIADMQLKQGEKIKVYVFSPGSDPYTQDFEDVADKVELCALPAAIYNVYRRVLKPLAPKWLDGGEEDENVEPETTQQEP